jgi:hypothetical protein
MRRINLLLFLCLIWLSGHSQTIQWASKVLGKSSEYSDLQYSANQALGKPNVMPTPHESPVAWSPLKKSSRDPEFLHLEFAQPMKVRQVCVAESHYPGFISDIFLYDTQGNAHNVYHEPNPKVWKSFGKLGEGEAFDSLHPKLEGRMFYVNFELTPYEVSSVKVVLETTNTTNWPHIDAVGISDGDAPIQPEINFVKDMVFAGKPENLGPSINSRYDEIMPVISPDGNTLYFDRKDHPDNTNGTLNDDIWVSQKDAKGNWSEAENAQEPFNNSGHNFLTGISADGNYALLGNVYEPDGTMTSGLSFSQKRSNGWSAPSKVGVADYYNSNKFSEFHLHANANIIVMTVQRKDGYGAKDLHVSFLLPNGSWSAPKNLGPDVNTASTEMSPHIAADGKTLYFATDGRSGYGNKDMFVTRRLDDTWVHWSEPQNLGPQINSKLWDAYYSLPASGEYAYFASEKLAVGKTDIFRIRLPKEIQPEAVTLIRGTVQVANSVAVKAPVLRVALQCQGKIVAFQDIDSTVGEYSLVAPAGCKCQLIASAKGYESQSLEVDCELLAAYKELTHDFVLKPKP